MSTRATKSRQSKPRQAKGDGSLDLAWRRLLSDAQDDLVPDPLAYEDFKSDKDNLLKSVKQRLQAGYEPTDLLKMDVPKSEFAFRPGSIPVIEDRLAYTALIGSFAEMIDSTLEDEDVVASYRVQTGRKRALFKFGLNQWFKFQNQVRAAYDEGYRYLLATDLTAYFDHIDHNILAGHLRGVGVKEAPVDLLTKLLRHWAEGKSIGIPQGLDPSSLLGNFYLDPLDKSMVREKYRYVRYVDDIRVFGHTRSELRRAMLHIVRETRDLGLHVQTGKTAVYENEEILDIINERQANLAAIDYHLGFGNPELAAEEAMQTLKGLLRTDSFNDRHFRKCLNALRKAESPLGVRYALQKINDLEPWAQTTTNYLRLFIRSHPTIKRRLMTHLKDADQNIYETPEFWFVRTLKDAATLPRDFLNWCRKRIQDKDCHWNCRGQYALLLGSHGDLSDQQLVRRLVASRENDYERRAFIVALKNLPQPDKKRVLARLCTTYPHLRPAIMLAT